MFRGQQTKNKLIKQGVRPGDRTPLCFLELFGLLQFFEGACIVLADGADIVFRQFLAFIDISAHLAHPAGLFDLRLRLDVLPIVGVAHAVRLAEGLCLGHFAQEHGVTAQIDRLNDLQRHERIDILRQDDQTVGTAGRGFCAVTEFVRRPTALETELLKHAERRVHAQTVDVQNAGFCRDLMRVVGFVDADRYAQGLIRRLPDGIDDTAAVLLPVVYGDDVQTVTDAEQRRLIHFRGRGGRDTHFCPYGRRYLCLSESSAPEVP